ncbi:CHASE2 domain-containing protein, partial [Pseudomonas aeruginosa]|nr:CHASE2 domain-containing protein [Pseudomonas aeruginosa]
MKALDRQDEPSQAQRLFRGLVREWLLVSLLLLPLTALLSLSSGLPLNNLLYDRLRNLAPLAVDPRILVVAIDDRSLESLGRWPWPRSVHAELLGRLGAGAQHPLHLYRAVPRQGRPGRLGGPGPAGIRQRRGGGNLV